MKEMSALTDDYGSLLAETKPEVIHDAGQNDTFVARLEELASKQVVTPAEEKLIELLTVLIENFEAQHYPVQGSGPLDVIRHLMEENHLRQKDLVDVFGTESIVSDVLNGKRDLAKDHIRKLSERFGVTPALFF